MSEHLANKRTMTRGHTPPDTLTAEDFMSLAQVRKDIWTNAMKGFGFGAASGYLLHRGAVFANQKKWITAGLGRNTVFASVMVGASLGSFLFATSQGKNSVHTLYPLFERSKKTVTVPKDGDDDLELNKLLTEREKQLRLREANSARIELERNRILRRASLNSTIKGGHGLSDSHGGHWVQDKE